jgi:hypothetical protein
MVVIPGRAKRGPGIHNHRRDGFRARAKEARPQVRNCAPGNDDAKFIDYPARPSPHSRALAALALHDIVALLDQALAFAILAFLLLLDVRAFIIGHASPLRYRTHHRSDATYSASNYSKNDLRTEMITRRTLISTGLAGLAGAFVRPSIAQPASPSDPAAIVAAIYTRAAKGKGDGGGGFVIESKAAKAKYLSKELIALWAKADAHTPKGDVGPVDFDPVTNSQEPDVKSFKVVTEKLEADKAAIAVTITGTRPRTKAADQVVHYDFVRDGDKWKIDDIKGSDDGTAWSIRGMLEESLKT